MTISQAELFDCAKRELRIGGRLVPVLSTIGMLLAGQFVQVKCGDKKYVGMGFCDDSNPGNTTNKIELFAIVEDEIIGEKE